MEGKNHSLDEKLIRATERHDLKVLVAAYTQAADACEQRGEIDAACFFLTHAYVYALEQGTAGASTLRKRLIKYGRES